MEARALSFSASSSPAGGVWFAKWLRSSFERRRANSKKDSSLAANWAKADPLNGAYVMAWAGEHADEVDQWKKDNNNPEPKPEDSA